MSYYSKCVPVLLYGLEACALNISDLRSLDFVVDRFFLKLFKTNNINIVRFCQTQFWMSITKYHYSESY